MMMRIIKFVLILALTGCSKPQETPQQQATSQPAGEQPKPELSKELNIYNWSNYIAPNTIPDFEKEFGVKVHYDNYASNEELLAKLQAGGAGYDIIVPTGYMVKIMSSLGLLAELDMTHIPNFQNIVPEYKNTPFDPGNKYSVPYQVGLGGLGINTAKVKEPIDSWATLWDAKYKGRISILDDSRSGFIPALKLMGYSINSTSAEQLQQAKEMLIKQKALVKAYTSDTYMDMLKSGDVWIAYGYSGDVYQVIAEAPHIKFVIPKEGVEIGVDNLCIPKNAPHQYTAEVFINYILRAGVGAAITNATHYGSPNAASRDSILPEILNDPGIFPPKEVLDRCEFINDVGEATQHYDRLWSELKSN